MNKISHSEFISESKSKDEILKQVQDDEKYIHWLQSIGWGDYNIEIASSDASFRSYYRLSLEDKSFLLMDSSRQKESLIPFIDIAHRLESVGVNTPRIIEQNLDDGYLIIEDFGSLHLAQVTTLDNLEFYYKKAIDEIILMQKANTVDLPLYDKEFLIFEMDLCNEWYLQKHLNVFLNDEKQLKLKSILEFIADEVLAQPNGYFVHRDYHCRNIMVKSDDELGIIDFQDARVGAITYDLVSLLKDCYYEIEIGRREVLALYFRDKAGIKADDETFLGWFDMMGLQRHIKVLGIFARLSIRDGKDGYLKDIPLTLKYVLETAAKYPQTESLCDILSQ
ncbi:MAG: phosphotransferase [Sulfurovaceae bacterium]|nr:phosphotransferase [Sulfurovaceae bacterium]